MNQRQRRTWLIRYLLEEHPDYQSHAAIPAIPHDEDEQRLLLRALLNVRPPTPISMRFLHIQDEYLQAELEHHTITDANAIPPMATADADESLDGTATGNTTNGIGTPANANTTANATGNKSHTTTLAVWQGDITTLRCDVIVNAANSGLTGCYAPNHRCIDNAIHSAAGVQLRLACAELMDRQRRPEPVGQAKITPAFNLPSQYVLHTVGPMIPSGNPTAEEQAQLADCYRACLRLAAANRLESIAFCCISTGEFRFPAELAARIAVRTVREFLHTGGNDTISPISIRKVIFDVFSDRDRQLYERTLAE